MKRAIGIDTGGTKTEIRALEFSHTEVRTLHTVRFPTKKEGKFCYVSFLDQLSLRVKEVCQQVFDKGPAHVDAIGMGLPGVISEDGVILRSSLKEAINKNLLHDLSTRLEVSHLSLLNDATAFVLAEARFGASREIQQTQKKALTLGVILGTGLGGGIVLSGEVFDGAFRGGSEFGHISIDPTGELCFCSLRGCAEMSLSGTALVQEISKRIGKDISGKDIFESPLFEDPRVQEGLHEFKDTLVSFLTGLCNLFSPHSIVLGGGLSQQPFIFDGLEKQISKRAYLPHHPVKVFSPDLGDSAGAVGAAFHALQNIF